MNDKVIPHVHAELTQYELGDGSFAFGIYVKDKSGRTHHISVKESDRNIFGKMTSIDKTEMKDLFKNNDIEKFAYDGSTEVSVMYPERCNTCGKHIQGKPQYHDIDHKGSFCSVICQDIGLWN